MDTDQTPINARLKRPRRPPAALEDASLLLREKVAWPLEDRLSGLSRSGRVAATSAAGLSMALVVVIALAIAGSGGPASEAPATVAVVAGPAAKTTPAAPQPQAPTLHGTPPKFTPAPKQPSAAPTPSEVDPAQAVESSPAPDSSAATDKISSRPSSSASASSASSAPTAEPATIPGPEAGPQAIAVASRFADAFVVYETGGEESEVRQEFAQTTTPELAKALLKRPPRLPANVKVPRAKVVNVVPGPSRDGVYTLSVSLLRVGVTSELRLEMEKLKNDGWRVTNVLG